MRFDMKPTPETIQAAFDEVQRFAQSAPMFKWAEIEDVEIEKIYPAPITPDAMPEDGIETIKHNYLTKNGLKK